MRSTTEAARAGHPHATSSRSVTCGIESRLGRPGFGGASWDRRQGNGNPEKCASVFNNRLLCRIATTMPLDRINPPNAMFGLRYANYWAQPSGG
jgi:hypothetical protein